MGRNSRNFFGITLALAFAGCSSSPKVAKTEEPVRRPSLDQAPTAPAAPTEDSVASKKPTHPEGPQSVTITLDQVSQELGVPSHRLESQVRVLARFLETRRLPNGYCSDEDEESTEKLCSLVDIVENKPSASKIRREGGRRVPIRPHHFKAQQAMGFSRLMRSISREPLNRVMVWAPRMLAATSCPRNLSAAALRRLESGLPTPSVRYMMEKLYEHAAACLRPQDEAYEVTHLRQGLIRLLNGNKSGAKQSFERAMLAQDASDRSRTLYWTGRLQSTTAQRNKYWDRLIEESPLSFHALEVWRHREQDPLKIFEARPALTLSRHVDNEEIDNAMRWLEALYVTGHTEAGQRLARWINTNFKDTLPPSSAFYVSALKSTRGSPLSSISFLTQQINSNPAMLNPQTLRLLFPRPYYEVFERHSPNTDTSLVLAVARQESGFNPRARSPANAQGLLQILPSTARILSGKRRNNLYDSEVNAQIGVKYLSGLIAKFNSVELALAGYNAGPGRIDEWTSRFPTKDMTLFMDLIPFKETRHYVANIVRNNYWYERLYHAENSAARSIASTSDSALHRSANRQKSQLVSRLVAAHILAGGKRDTTDAAITDATAVSGPREEF